MISQSSETERIRRSGSNPKRRVIPIGLLDIQTRKSIADRIIYEGSGHHKRYPADYGLERTNPRPTKSLCDLTRTILLAEARQLLYEGILRAMMSEPAGTGYPKYIWSVTRDGVVYEAKTHPNTPGRYHGYPLEREDDMKAYVSKIWAERCQEAGK